MSEQYTAIIRHRPAGTLKWAECAAMAINASLRIVRKSWELWRRQCHRLHRKTGISVPRKSHWHRRTFSYCSSSSRQPSSMRETMKWRFRKVPVRRHRHQEPTSHSLSRINRPLRGAWPNKNAYHDTLRQVGVGSTLPTCFRPPRPLKRNLIVFTLRKKRSMPNFGT